MDDLRLISTRYWGLIIIQYNIRRFLFRIGLSINLRIKFDVFLFAHILGVGHVRNPPVIWPEKTRNGTKMILGSAIDLPTRNRLLIK